MTQMNILFPLRASNLIDATEQATQEEGWAPATRDRFTKNGKFARIVWVKHHSWPIFALVEAK